MPAMETREATDIYVKSPFSQSAFKKNKKQQPTALRCCVPTVHLTTTVLGRNACVKVPQGGGLYHLCKASASGFIYTPENPEASLQ